MTAMERLKAKVASADPIAARLQQLNEGRAIKYGREVEGGRFRLVTVHGREIVPVTAWVSAADLAVEIGSL
jgi:hypothetical protein